MSSTSSMANGRLSGHIRIFNARKSRSLNRRTCTHLRFPPQIQVKKHVSDSREYSSRMFTFLLLIWQAMSSDIRKTYHIK